MLYCLLPETLSRKSILDNYPGNDEASWQAGKMTGQAKQITSKKEIGQVAFVFSSVNVTIVEGATDWYTPAFGFGRIQTSLALQVP